MPSSPWVRMPPAWVAVPPACRAAARGLALCLALGLAAWAAPPASAAEPPLVVGTDRGGLVRARAAEVARLRREGRRVEIRGALCLSSCTMFLGAPGACVSPRTRFGFHGPSYYGSPLSPRDFELWSQVIAGHYPEPLRRWYLETGRTRLHGYFTLTGAELIRLGVPACSGATPDGG